MAALSQAHMDALAAQGGTWGFGGARGGRAIHSPRLMCGRSRAIESGSAAERDYVLWLFLPTAEAHLAAYMVDTFPQVRVASTTGDLSGRRQIRSTSGVARAMRWRLIIRRCTRYGGWGAMRM